MSRFAYQRKNSKSARPTMRCLTGDARAFQAEIAEAGGRYSAENDESQSGQDKTARNGWLVPVEERQRLQALIDGGAAKAAEEGKVDLVVLDSHNTFPHKETIKAAGGVWDGQVKRWLVPADKAAGLLAICRGEVPDTAQAEREQILARWQHALKEWPNVCEHLEALYEDDADVNASAAELEGAGLFPHEAEVVMVLLGEAGSMTLAELRSAAAKEIKKMKAAALI